MHLHEQTAKHRQNYQLFCDEERKKQAVAAWLSFRDEFQRLMVDGVPTCLRFRPEFNQAVTDMVIPSNFVARVTPQLRSVSYKCRKWPLMESALPNNDAHVLMSLLEPWVDWSSVSAASTVTSIQPP